jgi:hypothetical protein
MINLPQSFPKAIEVELASPRYVQSLPQFCYAPFAVFLGLLICSIHLPFAQRTCYLFRLILGTFSWRPRTFVRLRHDQQEVQDERTAISMAEPVFEARRFGQSWSISKSFPPQMRDNGSLVKRVWSVPDCVTVAPPFRRGIHRTALLPSRYW